MTKRLLLDAAHAEELRVVVADEQKLYDFDSETQGKSQLKGNIYVAEVSRVEPSLQAAFISYGQEKNGFLPFSEVHPVFFGVDDKEQKELLDEIVAVAKRRKERDLARAEARRLEREDGKEAAAEDLADGADDEADDAPRSRIRRRSKEEEEGQDDTHEIIPAQDEAADEAEEEWAYGGAPIHRRYKIADVLKPGQRILVQVLKEERGTKGAALTTYFTLPGRYTVLMPNTPYAGGISRKVGDTEDRDTLKDIFDGLKIPEDMGLIIRTAGVGVGKPGITKDFKNLTATWKNILKELVKTPRAKSATRCVHENGSLIMRAVRDMAKDDIEEVIIAGNSAFKQAKDYAKTMNPDLAKLIKEHNEETPLLAYYGVEKQLATLYHAKVQLPSGGYLIINPTEALVSIDVNSGRATQGRNVEETAHKTNLEAADEVARQCRMRDLSGLIVIDFIDMDDRRHIRNVERAMQKAFRKDRARVQLGDINQFGLFTVSRQRLRPSFGENHMIDCPKCAGLGMVHSHTSAALLLLRRLEEPDVQDADRVVVHAPSDLLMYMLNHKRSLIGHMENKYKYHIVLHADDSITTPDFKLELVRAKADGSERTQTIDVSYREECEDTKPRRRGRGGQKSAQEKAKEGEKEEKAKPKRGRPSKKPVPDAADDAEGEKEKTTNKRSGRKADEPAEGQEGAQTDTQEGAKPEKSNRPRTRGRSRRGAPKPEGNSEEAQQAKGNKDTSGDVKVPSKKAPVKAQSAKAPKTEQPAKPVKEAPKDKPLLVQTITADDTPALKQPEAKKVPANNRKPRAKKPEAPQKETTQTPEAKSLLDRIFG